MRKLIVFVTLILPVISFSQKRGKEKIDSLLSVLKSADQDSIKANTLNALAYEYRSNDPDTAIFFLNEALALSTKANYQMGIANAYIIKSTALTNLGKYEDALKCNQNALAICDQLLQAQSQTETTASKVNILKLKAGAYSNTGNIYDDQGEFKDALENDFAALKIWQETEDKQGIASAYNNIGNIYAGMGNYPEALKNLYAALRIKETIGDKKSIGNSYNNIGIIYWNQGDYNQALKNHFTSLKIRQEVNDKFGIASSYNNIGLVYEDQQNYPTALKYYFDGLKIEQEIGDQEGIALSYNNIGNIYLLQGKYHDALQNHFASLKLEEEIGDKDGVADTYINIGKVYIKQNKYDDASIYLNKGLALAKEISSLDYMKDGYENLAKLDSAQGNYKQGLEHYKLYINYRDSLFNEENTKKLVQSQMQYEFDKKESLAKIEQDKKDAETKRIKNQQYFIIGALAIVVFAAVIIASIQYKHNTQKKKANVLLQQQKEKVESTLSELKATQSQLIQSEKMASLGELTAGIAHEIQNPLNFVNNFSEVNKELLEELKNQKSTLKTEEQDELLSDIAANEEKINYHGKRADAIVKSMLQHSRIGVGQKEVVDINNLVEEYLRLSYQGLRAKDKNFNAQIKTDLDASIGKINIVPQDIGRVLLNIFNNAFYEVNEKKQKTNEEFKPIISVQTKKLKNAVEIHVEDNGNGIPQNIINKIFQPFFTTKPTGKGTGLGLSLAYDIIKAHGGIINAETVEGEGTRFIITLPFI